MLKILSLQYEVERVKFSPLVLVTLVENKEWIGFTEEILLVQLVTG